MTEADVYDWDSPIGKEADEGGFNVLPEGEYPFEVVSLERGRYEGNPEKGTKPCPKAVVGLTVHGGEDLGDANIKENVFLNRKNAWKIKSLFVCLGLVDPGAEEFVPNWTAIVGRSGTCTLKRRQYTKDGETRDANDVRRFLPPAPAASAQAPAPAPVQPSFSFPTGA